MVLPSSDVNNKHKKVLSKSPQPMPERNKPESDPSASDSNQSDTECLKETASERKLGTVTPTHTKEYYEDRS